MKLTKDNFEAYKLVQLNINQSIKKLTDFHNLILNEYRHNGELITKPLVYLSVFNGITFKEERIELSVDMVSWSCRTPCGDQTDVTTSRVPLTYLSMDDNELEIILRKEFQEKLDIKIKNDEEKNKLRLIEDQEAEEELHQQYLVLKNKFENK
jgi:hypothetical protein